MKALVRARNSVIHSCCGVLAATAIAIVLAFGVRPAAAQTFSLTTGSPTIPPPVALCGPAWSPDGDIYLGPAPPVMVAPMGPPGCGLGWAAPVPPGNVDAFSSGLSLPPPGIPVPIGTLAFLFSVGPLATGDAGGCFPAAPGPFPPDVGSEACAMPVATDANVDIFATPLNPGPLPFFAPWSTPNYQVFDGNGLPAAVCPFPPQPGLGLLEPSPGGDGLDAFDASPAAAWDFVPPGGDGIPDVPVYYSVDPATAAAGGFVPGDVLVTMGGAPPVPYAPAPALGLDLIGGPGSDDLNALVVFDLDGLPFTFSPFAGDMVFFSVDKASAVIGAPDPCPLSPLAGAPIEQGDILTEGSMLGAPGLPCILVPEENIGLWSARSCGLNPLTGGGADNLDALDTSAFPVATTTPAGPTPTPTCTPPVAPTGPTPTPGNVVSGLKCQRTIEKETSKFVKAKMKALQKCHDSLIKDKIGPDPGPGGGGRLAFCFAESKTSAKISKAQTKINDKINKACGGDNKICDSGTGEESTAALGFYATCPDFEGVGCGSPISDCGDVAACVECISEAAVDQGLLLYYDAMTDWSPVTFPALNKCQRTIGKETTKFLLAKEKALQKCWDARLKGAHSNPCPVPGDGKAQVAIDKAEAKKVEKICKACGGADKQCDNTVTLLDGVSTIPGSGGSDDLPLAAIGFPASCPAVTVPGGGKACGSVGGGSVATLAELVECVDCVSEFKADCVDRARAPEFQVYPCECR
jgi:hypothetical protein